jgi:hypothetical protein
MATKKEVRDAARDNLIARGKSKTQRYLDQTENIKAKKEARIPNIAERQNRKNIRTREGRGQKTAFRVLDTVDRGGAQVGETLRSENFGKNVGAVTQAAALAAL